jgi:predicted aldo/keto reductase-like oxidoreductase
MRLPMKKIDENTSVVDYEEFSKMIDEFISRGFNYFDTAHGYLGGKSETALRDCLVKRYPREDYVLVNKLSNNFFKSEADIRPFFQEQLEACGVEYFDFYLMHAQDRSNFEKYKKCRAYETAFELKREGKVRHVGLSFHDTADVLDNILNTYPEIEAVQIQFNYADYEDASVESRKCLEVCRKHGKPVLVMEPVKGGSLVNLPDEAKAVFDGLGGGSYASYAIRFAASFDGVAMVLSGMGNMEMMLDNLGYMTDFEPLRDYEWNAIEKVCEIFRKQDIIPCTDCKYCMECCPMHIPIPALFACMNGRRAFKNWNTDYYYEVHTEDGPKASDCIKCGMCEKACPQHLKIRNLLEEVEKEFERK